LTSSLAIEVSADKLDLRPWRADLRIRGISLSRGDPSTLEIEVDNMHVALTPSLRLVVTVDRPKLTIAFPTTTPEDAAPSGGRSIASWLDLLRLQRIEAVDGELILSIGDEGFEVSLDGLRAEVARDGARDFSAHIQSETAALLLAQESIPLGPLAAGLRLTGPEVVLDSLRLESQGSSLDARGTIVAAKEAGSAADTGSSLSIEADFALSDRLFSPWRGDLPLRGEVRGEARFEVTSQGLVVDARIRSALLRRGDLQAVRATGELSIESGVAVLNAAATGYDGRVRIEAESTLAEGASELEVRWADIDLSAVIADLTGATLLLGSHSALHPMVWLPAGGTSNEELARSRSRHSRGPLYRFRRGASNRPRSQGPPEAGVLSGRPANLPGQLPDLPPARRQAGGRNAGADLTDVV